MSTSNPDTRTFLLERGSHTEATVARFMAGYGGAITMQSRSLAEWNDRTLDEPDILAYCRGWEDSDGITVVYCPTMIAVATSALPLTGDGSLDAYLDLVTTTWAAEFHAIRNGGCTIAEAIDLAAKVVDAAEGATSFMASIAAEAMDELIGSPEGDDTWAEDLGLS